MTDKPTPIYARRRTKAEKAVVVGAAEVEGVRAAARRHHVAPSTLESWRQSEEFARLRMEKREEVASDVWGAFQLGVRRIMELIPQTDDLQKVAVATGVVYDKYALISGEATSRSEHREVTAKLDDHELDAIEGWLHDLSRERMTSDAG